MKMIVKNWPLRALCVPLGGCWLSMLQGLVLEHGAYSLPLCILCIGFRLEFLQVCHELKVVLRSFCVAHQVANLGRDFFELDIFQNPVSQDFHVIIGCKQQLQRYRE